MPITDNMRMQSILCYPNAQVKCNDIVGKVIGIRIDTGTIRLKDEIDEDYVIHISKLQILLRPISSLTDEECIELMACHRSQVGDRVIINSKNYSNGIFAIEYYFGGMNLTYIKPVDQMTGKEADYLRSINIITTVHGFDLVKEGIAIVDDKIGDI